MAKDNIPIVTFEDDLGNEQDFIIMDVVEYLDDEYVVLLPDDENADEFTILKIQNDEDGETYAGIEDDKVINDVFELFKGRHPDDFNYR